MILLSYSNRVSDFIDAADVSGNIKNVSANLQYLNQIDNACSKAGITTGAVYPFIGGHADSHKFNFLDPRDLDAAFRLTYTGTVTHNNLGIKTAGIIGNYIDLHYNMQTNAIANNISMGVCISQIGDTSPTQADFGVDNQSILGTTGINRYLIVSNYLGLGTQLILGNQVSVISRNILNQKGIFFISRTASNVMNGIINGINYNNTVNSNATLMPNYSPVLGGIRYSDGIANNSNAIYCFNYISTGLNAEKTKVFAQDIYVAQRSIGR